MNCVLQLCRSDAEAHGGGRSCIIKTRAPPASAGSSCLAGTAATTPAM